MKRRQIKPHVAGLGYKVGVVIDIESACCFMREGIEVLSILNGTESDRKNTVILIWTK